jgi:glycosyltransferase involved in cell wall biosynthesis
MGAVADRTRVLAVTRLFPHARAPDFAPFNRQQLAALGELADVTVLGALPWFPGARLFARWSAAGRTDGVPREERIAGLRVEHPRALYVPRVGIAIGPALYAASLVPAALRHRAWADVLLAAWAYPDGVAGVWLGRLLGVPVVVKAHGSDLDVLARQRAARLHLRRVLPAADRVVTVSAALAERAAALGVPRDRIAVVGNGVDADLFRPRDRAAARAALGLSPRHRIVLFVGALVRGKGLLDLLAAFERAAPREPSLALVLVGAGEEAARCRTAAARWDGRIVVAGARPHREVATYMAAADVVTLPSWHEGTPNALIEAIASGRPVVATAVGGVPDLVRRGGAAAGALVPAHDVGALAEALVRSVRATWDPHAIAAAAPGTWRESATRLLAVLEEAIGARRARLPAWGGVPAPAARGSP